MQIHELNKRHKVNEAAGNLELPDNLVGPSGVASVGKQVLKNPAAIASATVLGDAKQSAAHSSAAASAAKLGAQGYKVGGSANTTTTQQQLSNIQKDPAVQQMVKNLAAQWKPQSVSIVKRLTQKQPGQSGTTVSESLPIASPSSIKDPTEQQLYNLFLKQQADKDAAANPTLTPTASKDAEAKVNQNLNDYAKMFQDWAEPRLRAIGVDLNATSKDPSVSAMIPQLLRDIAIEGLANPESVRSTSLVEEFFNTVIAANRANGQKAQYTVNTAPGAASISAQPDDQSVLKQYGLSLSQSQLATLGQAMRRSAGGESVIRNTGNELLNAVARLAGFQIGRS
jgi:hypothetical protein